MARLALPAHEKPAIAVVPAVGALDDPTARLASHASDQRRFEAAANVRDHAPCAGFGLRFPEVVSLVEAEVTRTADAAPDSQRDRVEGRADHPLVVDVRGRDLHADRYAAGVGQNVAFDAAFGAIGRVRTGVVPPLGAFTMALSRLHHRQSMPRHAS